MGLIDQMMDQAKGYWASGLKPDDEQLASGLLKKYRQERLLENAGDKALDWLSPDEDKSQERELRGLDIKMKRRTLGMLDSDDLDESRDDNAPLYAATGAHLLQQIPEPGFMSPKYGSSGTTRLKSFLGVAEDVGRFTPGGGGASAAVGRRLLKFLGRAG